MNDDSVAPKEPDDEVKFWHSQIAGADKEERDWRKRASKIVEKYRDDKPREGKRFNLLWANVETLKSAVFSTVPDPDVRRRFYDHDPVSREAAEVMERAVAACNDQYPLVDELESARNDLLLTGRGQIRVRYDAAFKRHALEPEYQQDMWGNVTGVSFSHNGQPIEPDGFEGEGDEGHFYVDLKETESARLEHVFWEDFRMSPAKNWRGVWWVAFRHRISRSDGVERFGESFKTVQAMKLEDGDTETVNRYGVWEIWDKRKGNVIFIADGHHTPLEKEPDPLGLTGFFPCPPPVYSISTSDTMVPVPEATIYQDQLQEIDKITARIDGLTEALKVRGVYASELADSLDVLFNGDDNTLVPVEWQGIVDKGRLDGAISYVPIEIVSAVIDRLTQRREVVKQEVYEISGIADLMRGATAASETATAQRIKGTFSAKRLEPRQKPFARFVQQGMRLQAEVMCEHFDPETFQSITGKPVDPQVMALLQDDRMRSYRMEVETDQTVEPDATIEKQSAVELLQAVSGFFQQAAPLAQSVPQATPLMMEMLSFAFRRFKAGREMESQLDQFTEAMKQQASQPDAGQAQMQAEQQKMQQQAMLEIEKAKMGNHVDMQKAKMGAQVDLQKAQIGAQVDLASALMQASQ